MGLKCLRGESDFIQRDRCFIAQTSNAEGISLLAGDIGVRN